MQVVADFVDSEVFWFDEGAGGGEGGFFEEVADFVAGGQEVVVADVGVVFAGGELGHGVVGDGEVV